MENKIICHCMDVSFADVDSALQKCSSFSDVEKQFEEVQKITNCSTGCGGCHNDILDAISQIMAN